MIREALKGCFLPTKYFVWYFFSILSPSSDYIGGEKKLSHLNTDQNLLFYGLLNGAKKEDRKKHVIVK